MSQLDAIPSSVDVGTGETPTYNIDTTGYLDSGDALRASPVPTAKIVLTSTNAVVPGAIVGSPGVNGNILQVTINGSVLSPKQTYTLIVTFNTTATKVLQGRLLVNCIF